MSAKKHIEEEPSSIGPEEMESMFGKESLAVENKPTRIGCYMGVDQKEFDQRNASFVGGYCDLHLGSDCFRCRFHPLPHDATVMVNQ